VRKPPDPPVYFLDRCLGRYEVADALRKRNAGVEIHDDHFDPDTADEVWLAEIARRGWIILTRDRAIRYRAVEHEAVRRAGAAYFVLRGKDLTGAHMSEAFARALPAIEKRARQYARPLIAAVSQTGEVSILEGERRGGVRRDPS
jgi:hypothetical protein